MANDGSFPISPLDILGWFFAPYLSLSAWKTLSGDLFRFSRELPTLQCLFSVRFTFHIKTFQRLGKITRSLFMICVYCFIYKIMATYFNLCTGYSQLIFWQLFLTMPVDNLHKCNWTGNICMDNTNYVRQKLCICNLIPRPLHKFIVENLWHHHTGHLNAWLLQPTFTLHTLTNFV